MTTTRRQLREIGMEDRFESLIEEVGRVRAELGHPIMVTPFPQMVVSQALFNVIGERYATVPDQVIRYALGSFGRPTAPLDPDVRDRILDRPRARELAAEPEPPTPAELRRQFGRAISDEELLLRAHMPAEQVDAMLAAGPAPGHFNPGLAPVLGLLRELGERRTVHDLAVAKPDLRLFVHRRPEGAIRA
jgi:oxaloacetate decarboxylase alpha subunit